MKEVPLEAKHAQVMRLLKKGAARIAFKPVMDSADSEVVQVGGERRK